MEPGHGMTGRFLVATRGGRRGRLGRCNPMSRRPTFSSRRVPLRRVRNFRRLLLAWYRDNGRSFPWRSPGEATYRLVVVEILLQRTQAEAVSRAYRPFFRSFPSWRKLSRARGESLEEILRPLGLWRRRTKTLIALASAVSDRGGRFPVTRDAVESLPGVGQYVANAIQLVRGIERAPLLDGNMARVLERYFGPRSMADIRYDPYLQGLAWQVSDCTDAVTLNWAILDVGALVCVPTGPTCCECPLARGCNLSRGVSVARDD